MFLRLQTAMILLSTGALASLSAQEARPAKPPTEEPVGPSASAARLRSMHDLLWLPKVADRHNLDSGLRRLLEALEKSQVPTAEKAQEAALRAKLKAGGCWRRRGRGLSDWCAWAWTSPSSPPAVISCGWSRSSTRSAE
jgi:hypothetical protein